MSSTQRWTDTEGRPIGADQVNAALEAARRARAAFRAWCRTYRGNATATEARPSAPADGHDA